MRTPTGLEAAGKRLWKQIDGGLPRGWELDDREQALLHAACRQADDLERLEAAIRSEGTMASGSRGQPIVNPAVVEARQARAQLARLLGDLSLPDEAAEPRTAASRRGQHAANTRWASVERKRAASG